MEKKCAISLQAFASIGVVDAAAAAAAAGGGGGGGASGGGLRAMTWQNNFVEQQFSSDPASAFGRGLNGGPAVRRETTTTTR